MFKKSRYNLEHNQDSRKFLYNSYTGALAEIEAEQYEIYTAGLFEGLPELDLWLKMGFLVPRDLNETKLLKLAFEQRRFMPDLFLTIAPTLLCNCHCNYCFQDKNPVSMSPEIYEAIQDLIINTFSESQQQLPIAWYGGEPFLCLQEIADFTVSLASQIGRDKLQYNFVTNGTLFDESLLDTIRKNAEIRSFQISLDGPQAYHDSIRAFKNSEGTYDNILGNLPRFAKYGQVIIRINVDNLNLGMMNDLLTDLAARIPSEVKPIVYFANIQRCNTNVKNDPSRFIGTFRFWESQLKLNRMAVKHGFQVENLPTCSMGCTYSAQHAFVIDPLGNCYKCWDFIGNPDFIIGNVKDFQNLYFNPEYLRELGFNPYDNQDCPQCNMLPLCKSGCLAIMNGDLPNLQERLSCHEIQSIFKKCLRAKIRFNTQKERELPHANIS